MTTDRFKSIGKIGLIFFLLYIMLFKKTNLFNSHIYKLKKNYLWLYFLEKFKKRI